MSIPEQPRKPLTLVTLADVALRCNVSKMTVSRALRIDGQGVGKAKAEQIRAVAAEMGYTQGAGHAARQLVMRRRGERLLNHLVAVFLPMDMIELPFYFALYRGIIAGLRHERCAMLTHYSLYTAANDEVLPFYERGEVDGALVFASPASFLPQLTRLRAMQGFSGCPVVSLQHTMPGCANVTVDERQGAYDAMAHLLALGHRRILHFWDYQNGDIHAQRHLGAIQACQHLDVDPGEVLVGYMPWAYADQPLAAAAFARAWDTCPDCTAILAPNDIGAGWIADCLAARGLRVPDEVSLVGFDDTDPLLDAQGHNILTTVRLPVYDMGYTAARLVVRLAGEGTPSEYTTMLPTALQVRASTGPAPVNP
jgi:LacI family transcriptional regulator